jgi:tripartite-type tricarboxylate transporter receptor subunit TctC
MLGERLHAAFFESGQRLTLQKAAGDSGPNDNTPDFLRSAAACHRGGNKSQEEQMTLRVFVAALAVALGSIIQGHAQDYPSRPITMIVPFAAGGPTDTLARLIAEAMRPSLGQTVIIENVTGAGSTLGVGRAVQAAPDGYTLSIGNWTSHVGSGALYPIQYDLLKDFQPISLLTFAPMMIVGRSSLPAANARELIAWLKASPDHASAATVGAGSAAHVCGLYFQDKIGTRVQFVPYRGGAPAMQDLVAGQIDMMCAEASQTLTYVRGGKIKAFAVMSQTRWPALPDVPTTDEVGAAGMYISFWHGLWVQKGTPKQVMAKLNAAVVATLADPTVRKRLTDLGQVIATPEQQTPAALAAFQKAEIEKWWPIIRAANIKVEGH